jgi:hypothetical protein
MYQAATTALTVEQQTILMEIMRIAEEASAAAVAAAATGRASTGGAGAPIPGNN